MTITLVIRLSSLGDVAILIPTLYSVASKNPDNIFLLITKKPLQPLFFNKPDNLRIFPMQSKDRHKGFWGLIRAIGDINAVVNQLRKNNLAGRNSKPILKVADLHAVIRSAIIDFFFRLKGAKIAVIDKNRKAGRALVRRENKKFQPLQTAFNRYRKVFERLGYDASLNFEGLYPKENNKIETWIGIAPFAKHCGKIYPFEQMEEVVRILNDRPATKIFLFGGKEECHLLEEWTRKYERVESVAGLMPFPDELSLMNRLDVMLSMDSANMHLASLVNTPVVSVWGATHPYAGFYSYNQNPENAVQIDLSCRPCSIFGSKPCWRSDYACLTGISPQGIVEKINSVVALPQTVSETLQS
ncbi:MAG: glycosyltransferase family 9 protein [Dysgonamonadaceae bacterium]|jgi:ADP-heptose:LPS heptosyltransferase|nr:glycosyltransferase family 9 protein [Dysgonamonadaceae bacterium]